MGRFAEQALSDPLAHVFLPASTCEVVVVSSLILMVTWLAVHKSDGCLQMSL